MVASALAEDTGHPQGAPRVWRGSLIRVRGRSMPLGIRQAPKSPHSAPHLGYALTSCSRGLQRFLSLLVVFTPARGSDGRRPHERAWRDQKPIRDDFYVRGSAA